VKEAGNSAREVALVDRAAALLGAYSKEQIVEHAMRTVRRETLLTKRKELLANWRRYREEQRVAGGASDTGGEGLGAGQSFFGAKASSTGGRAAAADKASNS